MKFLKFKWFLKSTKIYNIYFSENVINSQHPVALSENILLSSEQ